jgi:hypothetical protein
MELRLVNIITVCKRSAAYGYKYYVLRTNAYPYSTSFSAVFSLISNDW